jgi:hypothetical protein
VKTLILSLTFSACIGTALQPAADSVITHVTVIDVVTGSELKDQTVRIHDDRIASMSPAQSSDAALPEAIDAHGNFLIPGLWDMHVHVHDTMELPLYIANGVTGIRIMSGDRDIAALRVELARESPSPEIYLASAIFDGSPPVWPGSIVIHNPNDARRTVDEIKASGADFIKVYNRIPRDAYFALAEEAKAQHIDFEGHVPDAITAQEASAAGQRSMEHLLGISFACSSRQQELMIASNAPRSSAIAWSSRRKPTGLSTSRNAAPCSPSSNRTTPGRFQPSPCAVCGDASTTRSSPPIRAWPISTANRATAGRSESSPNCSAGASTNIGSRAASSRQTNMSPAAFFALEFPSWPERTL